MPSFSVMIAVFVLKSLLRSTSSSCIRSPVNVALLYLLNRKGVTWWTEKRRVQPVSGGPNDGGAGEVSWSGFLHTYISPLLSLSCFLRSWPRLRPCPRTEAEHTLLSHLLSQLLSPDGTVTNNNVINILLCPNISQPHFSKKFSNRNIMCHFITQYWKYSLKTNGTYLFSIAIAEPTKVHVLWSEL